MTWKLYKQINKKKLPLYIVVISFRVVRLSRNTYLFSTVFLRFLCSPSAFSSTLVVALGGLSVRSLMVIRFFLVVFYARRLLRNLFLVSGPMPDTYKTLMTLSTRHSNLFIEITFIFWQAQSQVDNTNVHRNTHYTLL